MSSSTPTKNVVVLGAGVAGLTTALMLQEKGGYTVTIIAETLPSDPKTIKYTSLWAGAYHSIYTGSDEKQRKIQEATFKVMWDLSAPGSDAEGCFRRVNTLEYHYEERDLQADWMPNLKLLPKDVLIPNANSGYTFDTYTISPPSYLNYLLSRFIGRGGAIVRGAVQHISQIVEGGPLLFSHGRASSVPVDAVVACPGLGARTLGGVEDKDVYPSRGQVVIIQAPWVTSARCAGEPEISTDTYIIPRRTGDVVLGGTRLSNDWYPAPRLETTDDILRRCLALYPELAPPEIRAQRLPTIDDLRPLIVEVGCGLRPARRGGIRLDVEWVNQDNKKTPIVFNYGHSGSGYESSWGSASIAIKLLEEALTRS